MGWHASYTVTITEYTLKCEVSSQARTIYSQVPELMRVLRNRGLKHIIKDVVGK